MKNIFFIFIVALMTIMASAAPYKGHEFTFKQPDGSYVATKVWGDEFYRRVESVDGYTLVPNDNGWICYAVVSGDGNEFIPTDVVYEGTELVQKPQVKGYLDKKWGLKKGLKISPASRLQKVKECKQKLAANTTGRIPAPFAGAESGESTILMAPAPELSDSIVGLTILIDFADEPATVSASEIDNFCNEPGYTGYNNNGSVRDYFYDVSNENMDYVNIVTNYYTAQKDKAYYDNCGSDKTLELIGEALDWLEGQGFDFTQLSLDSYNRILALNILYAGYPDCGWGKGLWPHSWYYGDFTSSSGVKSGSYQLTNIGSHLELATFCHENGHMICDWPDLYDYGYETSGIGDYGLMAYYASDTNPVPPNPFLRDLMGWESIIEIYMDTPGTIRQHVSNSFTTYRYSHPTNPNEYFLIESRIKTGRNTYIPDEGLLIWHIDENASNDNEQMTETEHYMVSLEQADGLFELEASPYEYGGSGDLFHAGYRDVFSDTSFPDAKWWDGTQSGLSIYDISQVGDIMSFSTSHEQEDEYQACAPNFWISNPVCWSNTYETDLLISDVFTALQNSNYANYSDSKCDFGADTLLDALNYSGGRNLEGAARNLLRQATASLLNASRSDITYPIPEVVIIMLVDAALETGDIDLIQELHSVLAEFNEYNCPIDASCEMIANSTD